jgi:hypothetical protein
MVDQTYKLKIFSLMALKFLFIINFMQIIKLLKMGFLIEIRFI